MPVTPSIYLCIDDHTRLKLAEHSELPPRCDIQKLNGRGLCPQVSPGFAGPYGTSGRLQRLWRVSRDGHGVGVSAGQEDAFAEEREGGAAVHLAFEQFGPGVEAFDQAGAPGQGQAVADGLVVLADAGGE